MNENEGIKRTSIDLPTELYYLSKTNLIEFRGALLLGLRIMLYERGAIEQIPNSKLINELVEKLNKCRVQLEAVSKQLVETQENKATSETPATLDDLKRIISAKPIKESVENEQESQEKQES